MTIGPSSQPEKRARRVTEGGAGEAPQYRVPMDGAGRMVIPKEVRRLLGLQPGCLLVLEADSEEIRLRPEVYRVGCLERKEGVLLLAGEFYGSALSPPRESGHRTRNGSDGTAS